MAKKKYKEIVHKSDVVITTIESAMQFIRNNLKQCIAGFVLLLIAITFGYAYLLYAKNQYDKTQYHLSQGIRSFDEYNMNGKKEELEKAETLFNDVAQKKRGQSCYIAKLYLAKINYVRGKNDDAKKLYQEVLNGGSNATLKSLSDKAIQHIDKR
jgi:predicted negative regulator of RcsB-dependent stress response